MGDLGTCSVQTLVHNVKFILYHSLLNTALSRWRESHSFVEKLGPRKGDDKA